MHFNTLKKILIHAFKIKTILIHAFSIRICVEFYKFSVQYIFC